jgi:hypothetical protein
VNEKFDVELSKEDYDKQFHRVIQMLMIMIDSGLPLLFLSFLVQRFYALQL